MPYVMVRDEPGLNLAKGDALNYEKGKLPDALKFGAKWEEGEQVFEVQTPKRKPRKKAE